MKRARGRPKESGSVRVTPEFRDEPDIEKLGRTLIAVAKLMAEQKSNKAVDTAQNIKAREEAISRF